MNVENRVGSSRRRLLPVFLLAVVATSATWIVLADGEAQPSRAARDAEPRPPEPPRDTVSSAVDAPPDEATVAAIRTAARLEAMLTDPVYEGKSMAGLIAMARSGEIPKDAKVLYVHLGGAPALNAYHKAFQ